MDASWGVWPPSEQVLLATSVPRHLLIMLHQNNGETVEKSRNALGKVAKFTATILRSYNVSLKSLFLFVIADHFFSLSLNGHLVVVLGNRLAVLVTDI